MNQEILSPLGKSDEPERALASIALTDPSLFISKSAETGFSTSMILSETNRLIVEVCLERTAKGQSCDIMLVAEDLKTLLPNLKFYELSEIATSCPIVSALPEFLALVKKAYVRRTLQANLSQALAEVQGIEVPTEKILGSVNSTIENLTRDTIQQKPCDMRSLLMDAVNRYEVGEDRSSLVGTGFLSLDDITPIRYGDFLVIGGEPKAGKTTLALNIIANIIVKDHENC